MFDFLKNFFKKNKIKKRTKESAYINKLKKFQNSNIPINIYFDDPQKTILNLHLGKKEFYTKKQLFNLRICRYFEGELQITCGNQEQATNAFMSVLFIDLIESEQIFQNAYKKAFKEKLPLEKFEKIFLFNASSLVENLQFKPPITPQEAWQEILKYREENNKK